MKRIAWMVALLLGVAFATAFLAAFAQRSLLGQPKFGITVGATLGVTFLVLLVLRKSITSGSKPGRGPESKPSVLGKRV